MPSDEMWEILFYLKACFLLQYWERSCPDPSVSQVCSLPCLLHVWLLELYPLPPAPVQVPGVDTLKCKSCFQFYISLKRQIHCVLYLPSCRLQQFQRIYIALIQLLILLHTEQINTTRTIFTVTPSQLYIQSTTQS